MKRIIILLTIIISSSSFGFNYPILSKYNACQTKNKDTLISKNFEFKFDNKIYSGILDFPRNMKAKSLVVLVPISGKTNVYKGKWNYELRKNLNEIGVVIFAYDKSGCGNSEGKFDYNQTIENSAKELAEAIEELKKQNIQGSVYIGAWGISRAGWIIPLAINNNKSIEFWISVSGPNHLDNMYHLLVTNWKIEGKNHQEIKKLGEEWLAGLNVQRNGGTYDEYLKVTPYLMKDNFIQKLRGTYTEERFLKYQKHLIKNKASFDEETGLQIMVEGFEETLNRITIPLLAIFREKDSQVDWRKSMELYENTIGKNALLTVKTLKNCNHFIKTCATGGFDESLSMLKSKGLGYPCDTYPGTIKNWLLEEVLGQ